MCDQLASNQYQNNQLFKLDCSANTGCRLLQTMKFAQFAKCCEILFMQKLKMIIDCVVCY